MPISPDKNLLETFHKIQESPCLTNEALFKVASKNNVEIIGKGMECVVLALHGHPKKVVALRYSETTPKEAKELFYTQRIMSTLFPHNFPKFHSSFAYKKDGNFPGGNIRQKVDDTAKGTDSTERKKASYINKVKVPFSRVRKTMESMNLPFFVDSNWFNFGLTPEGEEVYLDRIFTFSKSINKNHLINYMETTPKLNGENYTAKEIKLVSLSVDRLVQLGILELAKEKPNSQKKFLVSGGTNYLIRS